MSVEFESIEFDGKKKTVKTGEAALKAFVADVRKHRPPMSPKQRYEALLEAFEICCRSRYQIALRMKAALESNNTALIKKIAQQWVNDELPPQP
jgi:hypothetical protein